MKLFDGRYHAKILDQKILTLVASKSLNGSLALVQIGSNEASAKYLTIKQNLCQQFGIPVKIIKINENLSDSEIEEQIRAIALDRKGKSLIIQLPLPRQSLNKLLDLIPREKDVDLLSSQSREAFFAGDFSKLPPTVSAVNYFLEHQHIATKDLLVSIIGEGFLVGKPVGHYLQSVGAQVTYINNFDSTAVLDADVVISATGVPNLLKGSNIKPGTFVIDFGFPGDLDMASDLEHLNVISPAVGGMGPLVVRFLILNHLANLKSV